MRTFLYLILASILIVPVGQAEHHQFAAGQSSTDAASVLGPVQNSSGLDDQWDLLYSSVAGTTTGDNQLLGAEFGTEYFYITGGNSAGEPNQVYVLNSDGTLNFQFDQWSSAGWGWRDLAFDGYYLYGSDDDIIDAFDQDGNPVPEMNINGPYNPNRGLAYDPDTDHFWTASFSSDLYEFDRDGNVIWSGPTGLTGIYGLAWDDWEDWLWIYDQSGTPSTTFYQFDPINKLMTGLSYTMPLLPGSTDQLAGGAFFTHDWNYIYYALGGITQGTPEDQVFMLELYHIWIPPPPASLTLTPYDPPIIIPASGGSFDYNISILGEEVTPVTCDVWVMVQLPSGEWYGPVLGPANFTLQPGWYIERDRTQNVPANAPPGEYRYEGRLGTYPDNIWELDYFNFQKLSYGDDSKMGEWANFGDSFEMEPLVTNSEIPLTFTVQPAYPNPFNPSTTLSFTIPEASKVQLNVYDISGSLVATVIDGWREPGQHAVVIDANGWASGMYLYQLETGKNRAGGKLLLVK